MPIFQRFYYPLLAIAVLCFSQISALSAYADCKDELDGIDDSRFDEAAFLAELPLETRLMIQFPGLIPTRVSGSTFSVYDPLHMVEIDGVKHPKFEFTGDVFSGMLMLKVASKDFAGLQSDAIFAKDLFEIMMKHFDDVHTEIHSIIGIWVGGENLDQLNRLTQNSAMSLEEAAKQTWTGKQAAKAGFTEVKKIDSSGGPGRYSEVEVKFFKP